jgi:hypothetical protein
LRRDYAGEDSRLDRHVDAACRLALSVETHVRNWYIGTRQAVAHAERALLSELVGVTMANFHVTGVRTEKSGDGYHEHISAVQINWATILPRQTVVNDIRSGGDSYYTQGGGQRAEVEVVSCPNCTFRDYLKTKADKTTADNLLSLPRV